MSFIGENITCRRCTLKVELFISCNRCWMKSTNDEEEHNRLNTCYCSLQCREDDEEDHVIECSLYRAGTLLQNIFYEYRKAVFDMPTKEWESKEDGKILYRYINDAHTFKKVLDCLVKFPQPGLKDEKDRMMALAHMSCDDSVSWMADITKYILHGLPCEFEEVVVEPKGVRSQVIDVDSSGEHFTNEGVQHILVKVRMGYQQYALDYTSAQYGHFDPIVPWGIYSEERIKSTLARETLRQGPRTFGTNLQEFKRKVRDKTPKHPFQMRIVVNQESSKALIYAVQEWETDNDHSIDWLVKYANRHEYELYENEILENVRKEVRMALARLEKKYAY